METSCNISNKRYKLTYDTQSTNDGAIFYGHLFFEPPIEYNYKVFYDGNVVFTKPDNFTKEIEDAIKEAIQNDQGNRAGTFF